MKDIAKASKEITFSSVYIDPKRDDSYIQNNELFKKFKMVGDELNYPYKPVVVPSNKKGDFKIIQEKLFLDEKVTQTSSVEVFEARNRRIELDYVANTIIREVQGGKRYKDLGVYV